MRLASTIIVFVALAAGCSDGGSSGGSGTGGGGGGSGCSGSLSGAVSGPITACLTAVNYYPDGSPLTAGRPNSMFTLVTTTGLPAGIDSVGTNIEVEGAPSATTYDFATSVPGGEHLGFVHGDGLAFDTIQQAKVVLTSLSSLGDVGEPGDRNEIFEADGTLTLTVADETGATVTVNATF